MGKSADILTSAIKNRSRKLWPLLPCPSNPLIGLRARDHVIRLQRVFAVWGCNQQLYGIRLADQPRHFVLPAKVKVWKLLCALVQETFDIILLELMKAGRLWPASGSKLKL